MPAGSQRQRLLTAAVGLPVLAVAVAAGGWFLAILTAVAAALAMREFFAMTGRPGQVLEAIGLALGLVVVGSAVLGGWPAAGLALGLAFWIEQFTFLGRFAARGETAPPRAALAAALLYVAFPLRFLCLFSPLETVFILAVVMAADTGAYYAGSLVGGPKVWPAVSPGKTWAGTCGGLLASAIVASVFAASARFVPGPLALAGFGVIIAGVSQMGDFFESALKRAAGVKDSGAVLPGHGGVLDRIDGLLPAILVYAAGRSLLGLG
ncbi:MAG: phosphatidate cytidylyltransferase [Desulfovibrio sp.]